MKVLPDPDWRFSRVKWIHGLVLAPAALGGFAPIGAAAAELNLTGIDLYTSPGQAALQDQVTSITQFSDVQPTEWAYQALSNLIERYGCVAGYPDGTFRGKKPLSRWEAAALLNACLDRITEVTDELRRLLKEFEKELAILRGRVDNLEAKVGELEATQFSTTTRLRGEARWVIGGLDYGGNTVNDPIYRDPAVEGYVPLREAVTFNYDVRLNIDTSFTGKDLLRTQLRAGNFATSGFGALPTPLTQLNAGFQEDCDGQSDSTCSDSIAINRLYYQFPLGRSFTVVAGPRVSQEDLLPIWPSVYTADKILQIFQYAGAPGTYSQLLGAGGGAWWRQTRRGGRSGGWSFGTAYVSANGNVGDSSKGGIGTAGSAATATAQLAYTGSNWNLTAGYTYTAADVAFAGTPLSVEVLPTSGIDNGYSHSIGFSGYWQPFRSGWLPSISAGWGLNRNYYTDSQTMVPSDERGYRTASDSWMVGLIWNDVLMRGNALGVAFGQPTRTINSDGDTVCKVWFPPACRDSADPEGNFHEPKDSNYALEVYYKMQLTDNITVTPSVFWLSRPLGQYTLDYGPGTNDEGTFSTVGYLVQTTFRF